MGPIRHVRTARHARRLKSAVPRRGPIFRLMSQAEEVDDARSEDRRACLCNAADSRIAASEIRRSSESRRRAPVLSAAPPGTPSPTLIVSDSLLCLV